MDLELQFAVIRVLHSTMLEGSRDKFYWFLRDWVGNPDLYIECFSHPRLCARHLPYAITSLERV